MASTTDISLQLFASGYCEANASMINPRDGRGKTKFYAVWALLKVPNIGYVLFDTGYNEDFQHATQSFPARLHRWATPVTIENSQTAKSILARKGIEIDQIKYIIISHFHSDHICGLKDFPNSQFICSKTAYEQVLETSGLSAVSKGILHQLLPNDFQKRTLFIEDFADSTYIDEFGLKVFKLFGIETFKLIMLPGHARAMLGFIYDDGIKAILYATDASWSYKTFHQNILPNKVVKFLFDSWTDYCRTLEKLRNFQSKNLNFKVLFTHCPETLNYIDNEI